MIRIMFVCHGNICRSPMAEFIFKDLAKKKGIADKFYVASSATSTEEIYGGVGNPVYPPVKAELEKHGIFCDGKRAVRLCADDYDKYDLFICMDDNNIRNIHRIGGGFVKDSDNKIHKLMSYTGNDANVSDPWYSGNFETAYHDIYSGCVALLDNI